MRILIYSLNFSPELVGIGKYSGEMAEWLCAHGHSVRVVTAPPYYPAWKIGPGYKARRYSTERSDALTVHRCPLWVPARPTGLKRILHLASFALSSLPMVLWRALTWRPEIVMTVAPAFFCAPGGWMAARLGGSSAWLHVQDLELDAAFDLGLIKTSAAHDLATWVERLMLRRFDRVSTISRPMLNQLRDKGVGARRLELFPNWVDTARIRPEPRSESLRQELGIPAGRIVALYSGNMGEKQGLDVLVEAARAIEQRVPVEFVLCGDGSARAALERQAAGLGNLRFVPLQPAERLNALLNLADLHLLPQRDGAADLVMPSKLTSMLACGGAVIAAAAHWTEVARTVREAGGCVCPTGDVHALAECIERLAADPEARRKMGAQAREYALNHLDKSTILGELLHQFASLRERHEAEIIETGAHSM